MKQFVLGALIAPLLISTLLISTSFAKDLKNTYSKNSHLEKVYKAFDRVEVLPVIAKKPQGERLHILCGALAVYREAQGEDFESKKLEADVAFYSAKVNKYSACHEITKTGRYPWVLKSVSYIKPKNKDSWLESQEAALKELEHPRPVENVCNRSVFHPSRRKRIYKITKKLVFFNYVKSI